MLLIGTDFSEASIVFYSIQSFFDINFFFTFLSAEMFAASNDAQIIEYVLVMGLVN